MKAQSDVTITWQHFEEGAESTSFKAEVRIDKDTLSSVPVNTFDPAIVDVVFDLVIALVAWPRCCFTCYYRSVKTPHQRYYPTAPKRCEPVTMRGVRHYV